MSAKRLDAGRTSSGGSDSDSGGSSGGGGASGSSHTTTPTRDRSSGSSGGSSVRNRISSTIDSVRDRPGGTVAAAGLGVAAIPEPTPVTETTGLAVAGTALAAGAGIEAARQSEIGVPSRDMFSRPEVDTPTSQQRQSEVGVGAGDVTQTEIGTPTRSQRGQSEVGVPADQNAPGEVGVPAVGAAQQFGRGQQQIGQEEEEEFVIGRDTIEDVEETGELDEDEQLRQIREELERRQEFVRDVPEGTGERGGVRFPADEGATGTAADLREQLRPDFDVTPEQSLGAGTAGSGLSEDFVGGLEQERDQATGTEFTSPGAGRFPLADLNDRGGTGTGTEPTGGTDVITDTDVGTDTGFGGGTGTGEGTATMIEESLAVGTQQSQALAQQQTEAVTDEFAQPEQTAFEQQFAEPTQAGQQTGPRRTPRERPRFGFEDGDSDDVDAFAFETDDERFGTGFLSGDEAFEDAFGR